MKKPKIVILDGYPANPGDLSWDALREFGDLTVYEHCRSEAELLAHAKGAEILLINKPQITRKVMEQLPELRFIAVQATGYNVVDVAAARERGIVVSNVPAYSTGSVVQHTFALILELFSAVTPHSEAVRRGEWSKAKDFTFYVAPTRELLGLTFGIVGFGNIGQAAAAVAHAFGMKVLVYSRTPKKAAIAEFVSMDDLFERSDILSLHCPLTEETKKLVNRGHLAKMKKTALLVNTARGALIDEDALAEALNEGRIAGAALDVLSTEPPPPDNVLLHAKNCLVTPHIAWATYEARKRLIAASTENVRAFLSDKPINVVS